VIGVSWGMDAIVAFKPAHPKDLIANANDVEAKLKSKGIGGKDHTTPPHPTLHTTPPQSPSPTNGTGGPSRPTSQHTLTRHHPKIKFT
jgi:hypothetical protein